MIRLNTESLLESLIIAWINVFLPDWVLSLFTRLGPWIFLHWDTINILSDIVLYKFYGK